jgi:hypothetical protein
MGLQVGRWLWRQWHRRGLALETPEARRSRELVEAGHFYGQMVRALASFRLVRAASQTPAEFLQVVAAAGLPFTAAVATVTRIFCEVRYGEQPLDDERRHQVAGALAEIRARTPAGGP